MTIKVCIYLSGEGGESNGGRVERVVVGGEEQVWDTSLYCHSTPVQLQTVVILSIGPVIYSCVWPSSPVSLYRDVS